MYITAFIAWQVWRLDRPVEGMEAGPLMSGTAVLVESTAITTLWLVFFSVTYLTSSATLHLTTGLTPSIVGLANIAMYLRIGLGWARLPEGSGVPMTSILSMARPSI
ncbi:hypothetical protein B0H14DRAFT_3718329 [Mycena olivaceomarginata]|nr:hypothetical protein B0H14DRAFT_3718329 [Mycena olivaceomarginata]